MLFIKKFEA